MPEPTPEQQLKKARREIWELQRLVAHLRADFSAASQRDYRETGPLHGEIARLTRLLEKHGIKS